MNNFRFNLPRIAFGVELETDRGDVTILPEGFQRKRDGSISGWEFTTPPLKGRAGLDTLKEFMDSGRDMEAGRCCGMHAHFDMGNRTFTQLMGIFAAYLLTQDEWFGMVEPGRRNNGYAESYGSTPGVLVHDIIHANSYYNRTDFHDVVYGHGRRYKWLNIKAYNKFGTFENRLFQGNWDYAKASKWVILNLFFIQEAKKLVLPTNPSHFVSQVGAIREEAQRMFAHACYKTQTVTKGRIPAGMELVAA